MKIRLSVAALVLAVFAFECTMPVLSPHDEIKPVVTTGVEADHSTVTTFTFQSVAGKAGWGASTAAILGWIVATIKAKRRERAADELIEAIESCGEAARMVKSQVKRKANAYITERVAKLTAKG